MFYLVYTIHIHGQSTWIVNVFFLNSSSISIKALGTAKVKLKGNYIGLCLFVIK